MRCPRPPAPRRPGNRTRARSPRRRRNAAPLAGIQGRPWCPCPWREALCDSQAGKIPHRARCLDTMRGRRKAPKTGHFAAIGGNGLAFKCGDDKDETAMIFTVICASSWLRSTRSVSRSCWAPCSSWPASSRACWRCALARRCCWCFSSSACWRAIPGPGNCSSTTCARTYLVGSVALALILFDGGLRTRFQHIRTVLAPSMVLATIGVLLTAVITAPVARYALDLNWTESLLVGAVVASTDAAAVFLLVHAQGLRLRPRVGATLEAGIRQQRSVRGVPHPDAGRVHFGRSQLARPCADGAAPGSRARRRSSAWSAAGRW